MASLDMFPDGAIEYIIDHANDPNADLIGYSFDTDKGRATVVGTHEATGPSYVEIEIVPPRDAATIHLSVRPAKLVRAHKLQ